MPTTRAVTILFCDLVASTERRARLGDDRFDEFTERFIAALLAAVTAAGGREVSRAGDGMMVAYEASVADALSSAIEMNQAMAALEPDDPPRIRVGISTGEVAIDGENYSGMPIVEAARLEAAAAPGQILTTAVVRSLVGNRRGFEFRSIGALSLKGIPEPVEAVEVVGAGAAFVPSSPSPRPAASASRRSGRRFAVVGGAAVIALTVAAIAVLRGGTDQAARSSTTVKGTTSTLAGVTAPKGYTPKYEAAADCPADVTQVAADATCGYLVVPQDRARPAGPTVKLLVTRAPPRTPAPNVDPSIDVCGCENAGNSVTRDHAELIHMAQRGLDGSTPELTCPGMTAARLQALSKPSDDQVALDQSTKALGDCYRDLVGRGIDPGQFNFDAAAQDVIDMMYALGIRRADFTAHAANDEIVFDIMRRVPAAVRSITLDNPTSPGQSSLSDPVGYLAGAFGRFAALCKIDPVCSSSYPNLAAEWQQHMADPPRLVDAANPDDPNAPTIPVLLDHHRLVDALSAALDNPDTYGLIPAVINASGTDESAAALAAAQFLEFDPFDWAPDEPWGAVASYVCSYFVHTGDADAIALQRQDQPQFAGDADSHWFQWCPAWKVPDRSAELSVDVASAVPAFIFRGDLSPSTDSGAVAKIARGLPHSQTAIFDTLGGDLLAQGPPCLSDLRRAFLKNPSAILETAGCEALSPRIQFTPAS